MSAPLRRRRKDQYSGHQPASPARRSSSWKTSADHLAQFGDFDNPTRFSNINMAPSAKRRNRSAGCTRPCISQLQRLSTRPRKTLVHNLRRRSPFKVERYEEAKQLLVQNHTLVRESNAEPKGLRASIQSLIALYESWGKPEQAIEWQERLEQAKIENDDF